MANKGLSYILRRPQKLTKSPFQFSDITKGQIKPKPDWRLIDSPKNEQTNLFLLPWKANKQKKKQKNPNSFLRFLEESTARQSAFGFIWPLSIVRTKIEILSILAFSKNRNFF